MVNRVTKYVSLVQSHLKKVNHATNNQILKALREEYPNLTPTTVHRITDRLVKINKIKLAPSTDSNSMRFDSNLISHDHFNCKKCDRLRDVIIPKNILKSLQSLLPDCQLNGELTIIGTCGECLKKLN